MISDRHYMQDDYRGEKTSVVVWLICAIGAAFLLQNIFGRWFNAGTLLEDFLALSGAHLRSGHIWTLLTYALLHSPTNLLDLIFTVLGLYFLGRPVLEQIGSRRFLGLTAAMAFGGGLLWTATHWLDGSILMGAATIVYGLLVVFACYRPDRPITLLLFFILPVSIKPKYLAFAALFIDLCGFIFYEVLHQPSPFGLAHSAHLGGMAIGWLFYRAMNQESWHWPPWRQSATVEKPRWAIRKKKLGATHAYKVNMTHKENLRAEVDRILDKINSQGFGALTPEEKHTLDSARKKLRSH